MEPREALQENFEKVLELPESAQSWLLMLWDTIQTFDDYADGDTVNRSRLDKLIWHTLAAMPNNPFYSANSSLLSSLIITAILKWHASDQAERGGKSDAKSYMWRAAYYDIVLFVFALCHGYEAAQEHAATILNLYAETFTEYQQEFSNHA